MLLWTTADASDSDSDIEHAERISASDSDSDIQNEEKISILNTRKTVTRKDCDKELTDNDMDDFFLCCSDLGESEG